MVKKSENSKVKILFIVWSQCVLQCVNLTWKKIPMIKIEYLSIDTTFLSEWGYCVYIEIPLRLSPVPTFRALKNMSAVMLHFLIHICEYRITWSIDPLNTSMLWYRNQTILWIALYHVYSICVCFSHVI